MYMYLSISIQFHCYLKNVVKYINIFQIVFDSYFIHLYSFLIHFFYILFSRQLTDEISQYVLERQDVLTKIKDLERDLAGMKIEYEGIQRDVEIYEVYIHTYIHVCIYTHICI
jgi:hypothetical protein